MTMLHKGVYVDTGEKEFEVETCYHLLFQIHSIRVCINRLKADRKNANLPEWRNECEYYHFYCDHLLFSLGQISNRFVINSNKGKVKERIETNRKNFSFNETDYPRLYVKMDIP